VSHGRPGASGEGIRVAGDAGTRGRRRGGPRAREVERGGDRGGRARALGRRRARHGAAFRNAAEVFARASELIEGARERRRGRRRRRRKRAEQRGRHPPHRRAGRGRVRFLAPAEAADLPDDPDAVIVDEAAALPVRLLEGSSTRQRSRSARRSTATRAPVAGSRSGLKSACARARSRFEMCDSTSRSGTRETTRWRRGRRGRSCWTRARRSTRRSRARRSGTRRTDG